MTKALTIPLSNVDRWSDFGRKVLTPSPDITAKLRAGSISAIEDIIGHKFNRPHLLGQAMVRTMIVQQMCQIKTLLSRRTPLSRVMNPHPTSASNSSEMPFLISVRVFLFSKSRILTLHVIVVIRYIFDRDQKLSPGALTMLKAGFKVFIGEMPHVSDMLLPRLQGAMVSNSALAAVCVWSGLHEFLLFESSQLSTSIQGYAIELKDKQEQEYALAEQEGRSAGQYWLDIEPPKVHIKFFSLFLDPDVLLRL